MLEILQIRKRNFTLDSIKQHSEDERVTSGLHHWLDVLWRRYALCQCF